MDTSIKDKSAMVSTLNSHYYTSDIETLRDRVIAAGFEPDPIHVTFYGMTEFRVRDPDGNQVWIGARESSAI